MVVGHLFKCSILLQLMFNIEGWARTVSVVSELRVCQPQTDNPLL